MTCVGHIVEIYQPESKLDVFFISFIFLRYIGTINVFLFFYNRSECYVYY